MKPPNYSFLIDGVLAGSGHPQRCGNLSRVLAALAADGIGAIVSLDETGLSRAHLHEHGLRHLHLPVIDFSIPTLEQVRQFVQFVREQRARNSAVLVHCGAGIGRTGTMLACYLVAEGADPAEAIQTVRARRPGSIETPEQEQFVHDFAAECRKQPG
ncbi:MAG: dual specificity protein phosphatase 23 [Candidatus Sumerlaeaceae bacterium]|nr:dual specificity protein phosphatase 23 [Candidatus Sumerlaeaceae bacterium]